MLENNQPSQVTKESPPQGLAPFQMTDSAAARIEYLLSDEPAGTQFLVSVQGGGCSGFQYQFDLMAHEATETDHVIKKDGASVIVDEISMPLLNGSVLDYVEDLASAGFEIRNPNATARCGCGNSFSVKL